MITYTLTIFISVIIISETLDCFIEVDNGYTDECHLITEKMSEEEHKSKRGYQSNNLIDKDGDNKSKDR